VVAVVEEEEIIMVVLVVLVPVVVFMIQVKQFLTLADQVVMVHIQSLLVQVDKVEKVVPLMVSNRLGQMEVIQPLRPDLHPQI
tara:strand:+ start:491 stop:739 length:249 start_codon:yes stop_codon:yes gene_type:complete